MALDPYYVVQSHDQITAVIVETVRESRRLIDVLKEMASEHHQLRLQSSKNRARLNTLREAMEDHLNELKQLAIIGAERADSFYTW